MQIHLITSQRNSNNYQQKSCNTSKRHSMASMSCDIFTSSLSFKGIDEFKQALYNDDAVALRKEIENGVSVNSKACHYNMSAIDYTAGNDKLACYQELRKHPELDLYAEDDFGSFCFISACFLGNKYIVQDLVNDSDYDINHQSSSYGKFNGLMNACRAGKDEIVDIILQRKDVDLSLKDSQGNTAEDLARKNGYDSIVEKLEAYVPGIDRRKNPTVKKFDINKIAPNNTIWTEEEKQNIERLVEEKNYTAIIKLIEEKGVKLNEEYEQFRTQVSAIKKETEKSVRKEITAQIRHEETEKANQILKKQKAEADKEIKQQKDDLTAQQEEVKKAQQTLDKMIQDYQALHAEDLRYDRENLASGLMALYGINPPEKLPESINLGEQVIYVMDVLVPLQNKLKNINDDTPETITKAIQDDSKKISSEGLKFLERIINLSKDKCSEADLLDAIKSVKGNYGSFDMRKVTLFIRTLAWGNNTIQSSIKKVQQLAL